MGLSVKTFFGGIGYVSMPKRIQISICVDPHPRKGTEGCVGRGSEQVLKAFQKEVEEKGWNDKVNISHSVCQGFCTQGVTVRVQPGSTLYGSVQPSDAGEVVASHVLNDCAVKRLLLARVRFMPGF